MKNGVLVVSARIPGGKGQYPNAHDRASVCQCAQMAATRVDAPGPTAALGRQRPANSRRARPQPRVGTNAQDFTVSNTATAGVNATVQLACTPGPDAATATVGTCRGRQHRNPVPGLGAWGLGLGAWSKRYLGCTRHVLQSQPQAPTQNRCVTTMVSGTSWRT